MSGGRGARRLRERAREVVRRLERAYPDETETWLEHRSPFELLVATVLSASCTDARVNLVTPALFARYGTPEAMAAAGPADVEPFIRTCGLFREKSRRLVALAQALVERHGGRIPDDRAELEALPGVGRKTASVILANVHGLPALAVDTHVHRVANRLGLCATRAREKTEDALTSLVPEEKWRTAHHQLIHHGRTVCKAMRPRCETCVLADLCDFYKRNVRAAPRRRAST